MLIRSTTEPLLRNPEAWRHLAANAMQPEVDAIELTTRPDEAQQTPTQLSDFLQHTVGDAALQRLQFGKRPLAHLRIDTDAQRQVLAEAIKMGVDLNPLFASFQHQPITATPDHRQYLEGAVLGSAIAGLVHAVRSASGSSGSIGFVALTTLLSGLTMSILWPAANSLEFSANPQTGELGLRVDVSRVHGGPIDTDFQ